MSEIDRFKIDRWLCQANEFMFKLMEIKPDGFCADDFYELARNASFPSSAIKQLSGKVFREYQAAGYIEKTDKYRLSTRNGSTPLPIWKRLSQKVVPSVACELPESQQKQGIQDTVIEKMAV